MKKATVIFFLCFVLVLGCAAGLALPVYQSREEVEVTAEILAGDPAEAAGLTVNQGLEYHRHLYWDLTIPVDRPEDTVTECTYYLDSADLPDNSEISYSGVELHLVTNFSSSYSGGYQTPEEVLKDNLNLAGMTSIFEDVFSRAPVGEAYAETVRPTDYIDAYPLSLDLHLPVANGWLYRPFGLSANESSAYLALLNVFQDFFSFPIPEDTLWEIRVHQTEEAGVVELGLIPLTAGGNLAAVSAAGTETCYFSFWQNYGEAVVDFSNVPGGFGIYAIDYPYRDAETSLTEPGPALDRDSLRNVYPLGPETYVINMALTEDEGSLILLTWEESDYFCTLLDTDTFAVRQKFVIPAPPPRPLGDGGYAFGLDDVRVKEDELLIRSHETFWFYEKQGNEYVPVMTGDAPDFLWRGDTVWAWNGEKLAFAARGREIEMVESLELVVQVFDGGEPVYHGVLGSSLGTVYGEVQPSPVSDPNHVTLTWK